MNATVERMDEDLVALCRQEVLAHLDWLAEEAQAQKGTAQSVAAFGFWHGADVTLRTVRGMLAEVLSE